MSRNLLRLLLGLVLLAGITATLFYRDEFDVAALDTWLQQAGIAAPLLFMLVYGLATVFFLPGSVLTLAGGALFGPLLGTFYNLTGATLGAALAFLLSRYLASNWVEKRTGGRLKQLVNGVESEGWRFVAFVRLVPLFPFNLLNYGLGLTKIRFSHYLLASYICMLPGAFAYTYLGYAGREALAGGEGLIQKGLLALALLAVIAFLPRLIGKLRKGPMIEVVELKRRLDAGEELLLLDVRSVADFDGELGHVASATHIPLDQLENRLADISAYRDKPVITICDTDRMSASAAQLLARNGFSEVCTARMGMTDWIARGYPVDRTG